MRLSFATHLAPIASFLVLSTYFLSSPATAHVVITYPGWRGDNLISNCTVGIDDYTTGCFPYGMQWMYPCGGMGISRNRTYWPTTGGAVAFQPGWATGHSTAFIYVNMGLGTIPPNYSHPIVPLFQVVGPTNEEYAGEDICLPQVPLPANITVQPGDNATIQIVEAAKHGAALYSCVDITFTDDLSLVAEVNGSNCINSTKLGFNLVFATVSLTNSAPRTHATAALSIAWIIPMLVGGVIASGWLS